MNKKKIESIESSKSSLPKSEKSNRKQVEHGKQYSKKQPKPKNLAKKEKLKIILWCSLLAIIILFAGTALTYSYLSTKTIKEEDYWLEDIAYGTQCIDDGSLELGTKEVEQQGVNGKRRNYFEVTKKFLTGEQIDWKYLRWEDTEKPVDEIARCGTRKWQYMWCSDGSYRYYTDEQFANPNTGFTHASEDACAKGGNGTMTQLADSPPAPMNSSSTYEWYTSTYGDSDESIDYPSYTPIPQPDLTTLHDDYDESESYNQNTGTDRATANNICQSEANAAYQSVLRQLGAMGASGSASYEAQRAKDNTYRSCMSRYGF